MTLPTWPPEARCGACKHWRQRERSSRGEFGECVLRAQGPGLTFFAFGDGFQPARVATSSDFGCRLWEERA